MSGTDRNVPDTSAKNRPTRHYSKAASSMARKLTNVWMSGSARRGQGTDNL